jgi:nitroimidazol reductase NimA-like FMN-containing flavoprotein (pyridoxamine 5'-phosphate oxidase superfamily)
MSDTANALTELSPEECRNMLSTHRPRLGRLAFVEGGWPLVFPMNYVATDNVIYFRSAPGSKLLAALRVQQVSFEVDYVDEVWEEGWSILAFGRLRLVNDEEELEEARQLPLRPWARGDRPHFLRFDIARMSGRRIV